MRKIVSYVRLKSRLLQPETQRIVTAMEAVRIVPLRDGSPVPDERVSGRVADLTHQPFNPEIGWTTDTVGAW